MNTRPLTPLEKANLAALRRFIADCQLVYTTATGLRKSILDATIPCRALLRREGIHDFTKQQKGPQYKVLRRATWLTDRTTANVDISFYRPMSKDGDPRMWPRQTKRFVSAGDVLAAFVFDGHLVFFNLTRSTLSADGAAGRVTFAQRFLVGPER